MVNRSSLAFGFSLELFSFDLSSDGTMEESNRSNILRDRMYMSMLMLI